MAEPSPEDPREGVGECGTQARNCGAIGPPKPSRAFGPMTITAPPKPISTPRPFHGLSFSSWVRTCATST